MLKFESAEQLIKDIVGQFDETLASGCIDIKQSKIIFKQTKTEGLISEKALVDFAVSSLKTLSQKEPIGFLFSAEFKNQTVLFAKKLSQDQFLYVITHKSVYPLLNLYLKNLEYTPEGNHADQLNSKPVPEPVSMEKELGNEDMIAAKRIQQIMLSDPKILSEAFSKQFLYYKPHDSIGGDFYVFKKIKNNYLIVVGDCTGHGVEGALASMTVSSILNQLLGAAKFDLSEVIKTLYKQLENYNLNQKTEDNHYGIGVDLAIMNYDPKKSVAEVVTSGVLVQHIGSTNKLIKHRKVKNSLFSSDKIALKKGDKLYLYSDGLADQFDKDDKKKLGNAGVVTMIEGMKTFTEADFSKALNTWIGNTAQIDDITILALTV